METMQDLSISYEDMLKAGMHFGRKKTVFHPAMTDYVFTVRDGICIIDLLKTQTELKTVSAFLKSIIENNGLMLFVGLTKQSADGIRDLAQSLSMPYVIDRWIGGTFTNFKVIQNRVRRLEEMEKSTKTDELDKYTKKERLMFMREMEKMSTRFEGIKKLSRLPDVIFVSSLRESALPVHEAKKMGIKVVAITNTDADPHSVAHIIPANDRSKKSVDLILEVLKRDLSTR
ncbi:30S ribosomal protein S2 [Candidatus Parcubacteria bacterium]|nr:30S ribosomal protein S2 [Candidatus Parcubacteria bacterium]